VLATEITDIQKEAGILQKMKDYSQLLKLRLASLVVFSAVVSYLMAAENPSWTTALLLTLGGFLVTGASNSFNQIIEKDLDKMIQLMLVCLIDF
jgi:protoheme IX farnesyltransferase